jgi:HSP20 family protein
MARESRDLVRQDQQGGSVTPFRPLAEIARWEREMDRMLANFLGGRMPLASQDLSERLGIREPAVDIYEDGDDIVVKAEMPGVDLDNIEVTVTDNVLLLRGEKQKQEEANEGEYYRSERVYGAFVRGIPLPAETDAQKATANFNNGVLEVRIPKAEEAKKRQVKVNVEGEQRGNGHQAGQQSRQSGQQTAQQGQKSESQRQSQQDKEKSGAERRT